MPAVPLIIEPDPDDPDFANVLVDATIAGRPYRLILDTGAAARAQPGCRRTGRVSRPWMRVLGRQRSESAGTASVIEPKRSSSPPNAISASSRASGAPRQ